jgi:hypothetical protein
MARSARCAEGASAHGPRWRSEDGLEEGREDVPRERGVPDARHARRAEDAVLTRDVGLEVDHRRAVHQVETIEVQLVPFATDEARDRERQRVGAARAPRRENSSTRPQPLKPPAAVLEEQAIRLVEPADDDEV